MAWTAKGDEIFFHIASETASPLYMMDVQVFRTAAVLASPAIARKHLPAKRSIGILVESKPRLSRARRIHDAFGIRSKNSCLCEFGSSKYIRLSAKSRNSGPPSASIVAPARKSAQIISRE